MKLAVYEPGTVGIHPLERNDIQFTSEESEAGGDNLVLTILSEHGLIG